MFENSWIYWEKGVENPEDIPEQWIWERLRVQRDHLLTNTDFRMVADAPWDIVPWSQYRQSLRDLPSSCDDPREIIWPDIPSMGSDYVEIEESPSE